MWGVLFLITIMAMRLESRGSVGGAWLDQDWLSPPPGKQSLPPPGNQPLPPPGNQPLPAPGARQIGKSNQALTKQSTGVAEEEPLKRQV
jgi:hypothetical protein